MFAGIEIVGPDGKRAFLKLLASLKFVSRKDAAKDQLEGAVWLWFHEDDETTVSVPVSIHTLAVAAQGVLTSIAREEKIELSRFIKAMARQDDEVKDWIRNPQNFFKHGNYKGRGSRKSVPYHPDLTDLILADNIGMFRQLFGTSTPLLDLFLLRYSWSFPASKISLKTLEVELTKRIKIEEVARLNRADFLKVVLPLIIEITASGRKAFTEITASVRKAFTERKGLE
jgi:hypothetical protein